MKVVVECGQRWWRVRSWVGYKYPGRPRQWPTIRSLGRYGFAIGPIMFIKKESKHD